MPELRIVVLALQDRLAYGPTFQAALTSLFGSEGSNLNSSDAQSPPASTPASSTATTDAKGLIAQASEAFSEYQRLTAAGKLAEAGQKLDTLKRVLDQLNAKSK